MLNLTDRLLDRVTMYRLTLYYLIALLLAAIGLSLLGYLNYNPLAIAFSATYLTLVCWLSNKIFASVFEAPANTESSLITALILALIITPIKIPHDILFLTAAGGLAIASKYILAIRRKHIFNPAAVAVALTAAGAGQTASWWIGNSYLLPFVLLGGLLLVRKIERGSMVISFIGAVATSTIFFSILTHHGVSLSLQKTFLHSSLAFLAFVMLVEPATSPTTKTKQNWYGALAGVLFPPQVHILSLYSTPELTLVAANIFAYIVSPKQKLLPKLTHKMKISKSSFDFIFQPGAKVSYTPGQYMEWTLPHSEPDSRGDRRYFTLASSPTEPNLRLGVKFYPAGSSFKKAMLAMDGRTKIGASQLGGDFVMPADKNQKLAFIAGGIGITPYRSMLKYLLDGNEHRDIALIYSENSADGLAYGDVLNDANKMLGAKIIYTLTGPPPPNWQGHTGLVSEKMIAAEIPDYIDRLFYISGPQPMVSAVRDNLQSLGLPHHQIKTDFFPGYA